MERGNLRDATATAQVDTDASVNGFLGANGSNPPDSSIGARRDNKPSHYKVICISMYTDDLKRLDSMVESLKTRGLTKANRSALIRYALSEVDLDRVPKGL
ncbi:MAG TPA: hypothetical protein VL137_03800 [Polyangiaceae bacterium]|nr:hypothetical protein [Polyangiaceae bacterium]